MLQWKRRGIWQVSQVSQDVLLGPPRTVLAYSRMRRVRLVPKIASSAGQADSLTIKILYSEISINFEMTGTQSQIEESCKEKNNNRNILFSADYGIQTLWTTSCECRFQFRIRAETEGVVFNRRPMFDCTGSIHTGRSSATHGNTNL